MGTGQIRAEVGPVRHSQLSNVANGSSERLEKLGTSRAGKRVRLSLFVSFCKSLDLGRFKGSAAVSFVKFTAKECRPKIEKPLYEE